ncbi:MAG: hypothetical protein ACOCYE_06780 [Pseudomonadota bacterium]
MTAERRRTQRYVVEGLDVRVDGTQRPVLDMSSDHIRLLCCGRDHAPPPSITLDVSSQEGFPALRFRCAATLVRTTLREAVYAYHAPLADWPYRLPAFDTFKDFHLADLEG